MARKATRKEAPKTVHEDINERLHDAIDGLRKDVTRVEVWATALGSFSQPVPDYKPDPKFTLPEGNDTRPKQPENARPPEPKKGSR